MPGIVAINAAFAPSITESPIARTWAGGAGRVVVVVVGLLPLTVVCVCGLVDDVSTVVVVPRSAANALGSICAPLSGPDAAMPGKLVACGCAVASPAPIIS